MKRTKKTSLEKQLNNDLTSSNTSNCILVVGKKGTGKSTYIIKQAVKSKQNKIILVSPKITKAKKIINKKKNILLINDVYLFKYNILNKKYKNTLFVFDDCKQYIHPHPYQKHTQAIINFLISSRHSENDFIFVFHSLEQVTYRFYSLIDKIQLFKSQDNIQKMKKYFNDYEIFEKKYKEVNNSDSEYYNVEIYL